MELVNTAIEKTVDICSPQFNRLAKMAKDCAAAAVLISAIGAVIVGVLLFADTEIIKGILFFYSENLIALIGLLLFTALALLFIFIPAGKYERKK